MQEELTLRLKHGKDYNKDVQGVEKEVVVQNNKNNHDQK